MKLCYIEGPWAWFTTADLKDQWGDDWNDAPYEHNAGAPYEWTPDRKMSRYRLSKVAWDGPLETPAMLADTNSLWSVEEINAGRVAWLQTGRYAPKETPSVHIWAGTSLDDFCRLVERVGGTVYLARARPRESETP